MHSFLERSHWVQAGRFSSHLILRSLRGGRERVRTGAHTRRVSGLHPPRARQELPEKEAAGDGTSTHLQLLQPVLTFGLLVRARLGLDEAASVVMDAGVKGPVGVAVACAGGMGGEDGFIGRQRETERETETGRTSGQVPWAGAGEARTGA